MKNTEQIALGLFLLNKQNKKDFELFLEKINNYLKSLNPNLSKEQKLELLT